MQPTSMKEKCEAFLTNLMEITIFKSEAPHYQENSLVKYKPIKSSISPLFFSLDFSLFFLRFSKRGAYMTAIGLDSKAHNKR